jgi:hypothetical protein
VGASVDLRCCVACQLRFPQKLILAIWRFLRKLQVIVNVIRTRANKINPRGSVVPTRQTDETQREHIGPATYKSATSEQYVETDAVATREKPRTTHARTHAHTQMQTQTFTHIPTKLDSLAAETTKGTTCKLTAHGIHHLRWSRLCTDDRTGPTSEQTGAQCSGPSYHRTASDTRPLDWDSWTTGLASVICTN